MSWLRKLKRRHRMALIVAAIFLPVMVLAGVLIAQTSARIAFAERELKGTAYLRSVWSVVAALDVGEGVRTEPLEQAGGKYNDELKLDADYRTLMATLAQREVSAEGIEVARSFLTRIADGSNLTLDPKIDSYYLMNLAVTILPETSYRSKMLDERILATQGRALTARDAADIEAAVTLTALSGRSVAAAVTTASKGSGSDVLRAALARPEAAFDQALQAYVVRARTIAAKGSIDEADLRALAMERHALDLATDNLWLVTVNQLDRLLARRIAEAQLELWLTLGVALLIAVAAVGAAVYLDMYVQREEVLKLNATLRETNEELERFAYICSHDMQEPVRMMNLYAGLLAEDATDRLDEASRRHVQYIRDNAVRMQKMIRDILAFSRVGRDQAAMEKVDCNSIMREVLVEYDSAIAAASGRVTFDDLPVVVTNITLMRVLLQNLVGNALKYHDGRRPPEIHVSARQDGDMWRFEVRDNGIGIDEVHRDKVFTMFQRLHRNEDYPGTGIGLAICKKFVRLCGGDITFASVPGQGTAFIFTLPAK